MLLQLEAVAVLLLLIQYEYVGMCVHLSINHLRFFLLLPYMLMAIDRYAYMLTHTGFLTNAKVTTCTQPPEGGKKSQIEGTPSEMPSRHQASTRGPV